jgi:hypothetical protein
VIEASGAADATVGLLTEIKKTVATFLFKTVFVVVVVPSK